LLDVQAQAVREAFPMAELIVGAPACGAVVAAKKGQTGVNRFLSRLRADQAGAVAGNA
jgi:ABC-type uncharacterized transport system permease subunit